MPEPKYLFKGADFGGNNEAYRYLLWREWDSQKPVIVWIMLNPSTADDKVLDPTLRRCLQFSIDNGYGRMEILNLFALRSTDPKLLYRSEDPVGWRNNITISRACERLDRTIVAAWGVHGVLKNRDKQVIDIVTKSCGKDLYCFKLTKSGIPGHPLYLRGDIKMILFRGAVNP